MREVPSIIRDFVTMRMPKARLLRLARPGLGATRFPASLNGIEFRLGVAYRLRQHLPQLVFSWGLWLGFPLLRHRFSPVT
jgi:hypothetical protein